MKSTRNNRLNSDQYFLTLIFTLFFTTACVKEEQETVTSNPEQVSSETKEDREFNVTFSRRI